MEIQLFFTLWQFQFITSPVLFTKLHEETIEWEKRRYFAYMAASAYYEEIENHIFRHNWIFRHTCMYQQPTLTTQWDYNIFEQILHIYFKYTGSLFLRCALFVTRCNIIRTTWETKKERFSYSKKYKEEFVWGTSLFWLHAIFSTSFFVAFFIYSLPSSKVVYLLNISYKDA